MAVDPNFNQVLSKHSFLMVIWKTYLDSLDSVFNLIDTALWGEGVHTTIVVLFAIREHMLERVAQCIILVIMLLWLTCPSTFCYKDFVKILNCDNWWSLIKLKLLITSILIISFLIFKYHRPLSETSQSRSLFCPHRFPHLLRIPFDDPLGADDSNPANSDEAHLPLLDESLRHHHLCFLSSHSPHSWSQSGYCGLYCLA